MPSLISKLNQLLTGDSISFSDDTRAEGINFIYSNLRRISFSMAILPITASILLWGEVNNIILIAWLSWAIGIIVTRHWLAHHYFKRKRVTQNILSWGRYFTYTSFASGLFYGSTIIIFWIPDSLPTQLFILVFIIGMANGATFITSHLLESYYAFLLPTLGITSLFLLLSPDTNSAYTAIAILTSANILIALIIGKKSNHYVLSSIQHRFENLELVEKLKKGTKDAEESNRRKTRFLASASHDLRQPIHALGLFSEALTSENLSPNGVNTLSFLKQSVTSLRELINSLLDISRLDAGIITPNFGAVNVSDLIEILKHDFEEECKAKNLKLYTQGSEAWVYSDSILLENILRNLINNAIRYTQKGSVVLSCKQQNNIVLIEVLDTGVGISESEQALIFDEFYQINNTSHAHQQGLGLGLAIVQSQAKLLKHKLSVHSRVGHGTCFRLRLKPADPSMYSSQRDNFVDSMQLMSFDILIIDDDEAILEGMKMTLEEWGCRITTASSLNEAITLCIHHKPDIIISDFHLRDQVTGLDVVKRLREQLDKTVPALLITGDTAPERLQEAQQNDLILLHKPVKPAKLRAAIKLL